MMNCNNCGCDNDEHSFLYVEEVEETPQDIDEEGNVIEDAYASPVMNPLNRWFYCSKHDRCCLI